MKMHGGHQWCTVLGIVMSCLPPTTSHARSDQDAFVVNECDTLDNWSFLGNVNPDIEPNDTGSGSVLAIAYQGKGSFRVTTKLPANPKLSPWHMFSFRIRGAQANATAQLWVQLICDNGAVFRKQYHVSNMEWAQIFLLPKDFRGWERGPNPDWIMGT